MILIIDNYDSFTYNLYQYIGRYEEVQVFRNDEISVEEVKLLKPKGIVISPGPGEPGNSGVCKEIVNNFKGEIPILGVCLGHQIIGEVFKGKVVRAERILHGKTSEISIMEENKLFKDIKETISVMRYHSLILDNKSMPKELKVIAKTAEEIMAIKHSDYEIYGVQFHPESIFTKDGEKIIQNFVEVICNDN